MMTAERKPDQTRRNLLEAAAREFHLKGFQGASLDAILAMTGMTKGALYHHFPNKAALGYAVVDEVIRPTVVGHWIDPLRQADDPITAFKAILQQASAELGEEAVRLGCPLNNLSQEMSPLDEGFRQRIDAIYGEWRDAIAESLQRGMDKGVVRTDVKPQQAATMIIATLEGCIGMAKNAQSLNLLQQCGLGLLHYLESLRA